MRLQQLRSGLVMTALVAALGFVGCGGSKEFTEDDFKKVGKDMPQGQRSTDRLYSSRKVVFVKWGPYDSFGT